MLTIKTVYGLDLEAVGQAIKTDTSLRLLFEQASQLTDYVRPLDPDDAMVDPFTAIDAASRTEIIARRIEACALLLMVARDMEATGDPVAVAAKRSLAP